MRRRRHAGISTIYHPHAGSLQRGEILLHPAALARIRYSAESGTHVVQHVCLPSALAKRKQSQKALKANIQDICMHWTAIWSRTIWYDRIPLKIFVNWMVWHHATFQNSNLLLWILSKPTRRISIRIMLLNVIYVNFNSTTCLICSIESLYKNNNGKSHLQIIVVDNSFQDDPHRLKELFPEISLFLNRENTGDFRWRREYSRIRTSFSDTANLLLWPEFAHYQNVPQ